MQIRPATRKGVNPIVSLYGESGSGKSYSALLLARGFVGPKGKMVQIDSENGRGELYADVKEIGGYDVLPLSEPFSPMRYVEAIDAVEKSGAAIGIIDQASSEWDGIGSVLDMAEENREKSGASLNNWRKPKMEHALFIQKLLRSPIPWVVLLRAKYKTRQVKNGGKTEIVRDEHLTPLQADDFIFESTIHGYITLDHNFWPTKISHPALAACLPNGKPITLEHGRLLAQWCAAPGETPKAATSTATTDDKRTLQTELRTVTESIHGWKKGDSREKWENESRQKLESWLLGQGIIGDAVTLADLSVERLGEVLTETKAALRGGNLL